MPKLTVENVGEFEVPEGKRLVLALKDEAGIDQLHACGGNARCTTCRVEFLEGEPSKMTAAEKDLLVLQKLFLYIKSPPVNPVNFTNPLKAVLVIAVVRIRDFACRLKVGVDTAGYGRFNIFAFTCLLESPFTAEVYRYHYYSFRII